MAKIMTLGRSNGRRRLGDDSDYSADQAAQQAQQARLQVETAPTMAIVPYKAKPTALVATVPKVRKTRSSKKTRKYPPGGPPIGTCVCKINRKLKRYVEACFIGIPKRGEKGRSKSGWQFVKAKDAKLPGCKLT